MSEETQQSQEEPQIECSMCGVVGGPQFDCPLCEGNPRFVQPRAYTLTEERQGAKSDPERYDRTGNVNIKIVKLPGSDPRMGN